jgi:hypothetical protein
LVAKGAWLVEREEHRTRGDAQIVECHCSVDMLVPVVLLVAVPHSVWTQFTVPTGKRGEQHPR